MSDAIRKIRDLLDELEVGNPGQAESFRESFQLFELPELVGDIFGCIGRGDAAHARRLDAKHVNKLRS